jgi:5-formyltetrahydrofolate cyclo-ligase
MNRMREYSEDDPGPAIRPEPGRDRQSPRPGTPSDVPDSPPANSAGADLAAAKAALRRQLLAARAERGEDDRVAAARLLRDTILELPQAQMAGTIAAYVSVGAEPATRSLIFAFWKRGAYVLLPRLRPDHDLDWASYEGPDSLAPGPKGLLEPTEPPRGVKAITSADLVIVPALAVDRRGRRLGRGGGSYDRALARVGAAVHTIALLYDDEVLDEIPAGPLDQPVRFAVQPAKGITSFS